MCEVGYVDLIKRVDNLQAPTDNEFLLELTAQGQVLVTVITV